MSGMCPWRVSHGGSDSQAHTAQPSASEGPPAEIGEFKQFLDPSEGKGRKVPEC